jgi:signal transduction histidine kinase
MTELIESLLELARSRETLRCVEATVDETVQEALRSLRLRPEFRNVQVSFHTDTRARAFFDPQKLGRALYNLLMNACGAAASNNGNAKVEVTVASVDDRIELRVVDNGPGVADIICQRLFQPFVSYGKANGTGLGLTIVKKIVEDHGGTVALESTSPGRTVFRISLPSASRTAVPVSGGAAM